MTKENGMMWLMNTEKCLVCGKVPKPDDLLICDTVKRLYGHVTCYKK